MAHLKLVGHKRFSSPHIEEDVVLKGGVIEVSAKVAAGLLESTHTDIANNVHPVWVDVSEEYAAEVVEAAEEDDEGPAPVVQPTAVNTAAPAKPAAAKAAPAKPAARKRAAK